MVGQASDRKKQRHQAQGNTDEDRDEAGHECRVAGPKRSQRMCQPVRRDQLMARHLDEPARPDRALLSSAFRLKVLVNLLEKFELPLHLILGDAVAFLDLPGQLVAFAGDQLEITVREPAPFFFHMSLELLPIAFNHVPIHGVSLRDDSNFSSC